MVWAACRDGGPKGDFGVVVGFATGSWCLFLLDFVTGRPLPSALDGVFSRHRSSSYSIIGRVPPDSRSQRKPKPFRQFGFRSRRGRSAPKFVVTTRGTRPWQTASNNLMIRRWGYEVNGMWRTRPEQLAPSLDAGGVVRLPRPDAQATARRDLGDLKRLSPRSATAAGRRHHRRP